MKAKNPDFRARCLAALAALFLTVPIPATAASRVWDGGGTGNTWTQASNWTGLRIDPPDPGDDLTFPAGAARLSNTNNYAAGTAFNSITYSGAGYNASGNSVALTAGLNATHGAGSTTADFDIGLDANQAFTVSQAGATLHLTGDISLGFRTLTFTGAGQTIVWANIGGLLTSGRVIKSGGGLLLIVNSPAYAGSTTVNGGTLRVDGSLPNSNVLVNNNGLLRGDGPVSALTVNTGGAVSPGVTSTDVLVCSGNLALNAGSTCNVRLNGLAAGTGYDQIAVTGTVTLGGTLNVTAGFAVPVGTVFTIIDNDGSDDVGGTFAGLPEGAEFMINGRPFRISYGTRSGGGFGHDTNNVTVEAIPALSIWNGGGGANKRWATPENWVGQVTPQPGDDLQFPNPGGGGLALINDFPPGSVFGSIILGEGYISLEGNAARVDGTIRRLGAGDTEILFQLTLGGGLQLTQQGRFTWNAGAALSASQTFALEHPQAFLVMPAQLGLAGHTLTVKDENPFDDGPLGYPIGYGQAIFPAGISGQGTVRKQGAGIMTVPTAGCTCSQITVDGGTFRVRTPTNTAPTELTGAVTVNSGGVFDLEGRVLGDTLINAGGQLRGFRGELSNLEVRGGTFAPRDFDIAESLTMSDGAVYSTYISFPGGPDNLIETTRAAVHGPIALTSVSLEVYVEDNLQLPTGRVVGIISGPAPAGTFTGLPPLAHFAAGGNSFSIDYAIGVKLTANPPCVWDGAGADTHWLTAGNWNPDYAPFLGSPLVFPDGVSQRFPVNNFPAGTVFRSLTFQRNSYIVAGNAFQLTEGIFNEAASGVTPVLTDMTFALPDLPVQVAGSSELQLNGSISGSFTKTGPGTLHFTGTAPNAVSAKILDGRVDLEKSGALALNDVTVGDGSAAPTLRLLADHQISDVSIVNLFAPARLDLNDFDEGLYFLQRDGTVVLGDLFGRGGTLTIQRGNFDGSITGKGSLIKAGTSDLHLGGSSNFTGTTIVAEGRLQIDGTITASTIRIDGGILKGRGQVAVINGNGGVLAPGTGLAGNDIKLRSKNVSLTPATTFRSLLTGVDPGFENQKLSVAGTVNLGGSILDLDRLGGPLPALGKTFILLENDGTEAVTGTFAGLPQGTVFEQLGLRWQINYAGGDGNDVAVSLLDTLPVELNSMSITHFAPTGFDIVEIYGSGIAGVLYDLNVSTDLVNWTTPLGKAADPETGELHFTINEFPTTRRRYYRFRQR